MHQLIMSWGNTVLTTVRTYPGRSFLGLIAMVMVLKLIIGILSPAPTEEFSAENSDASTAVEYLAVQPEIFGVWEPEGSQVLLGLVETSQETDLLAEVGGTLEQVLVRVGQTVESGQVLATYKTRLNTSQVDYQNASLALQNTIDTSRYSTTNAEQTLANLKQQLDYSRRSTEAQLNATTTSLRQNLLSSDNESEEIIEYLDRFWGISAQYFSIYTDGRDQVGALDTVGRTNQKSALRKFLRSFETRPVLDDAADLATLTQNRISILQTIRTLLQDQLDLVDASSFTTSFTEDSLSAVRSTTQGYLEANENYLSTITNALAAWESLERSVALEISNLERSVEASETALKLTIAQGEQSIQQAQNQLNLSQVSQQKLTVTAPFSGRITQVPVKAGQQVSVGSKLLSLTNQEGALKVVTDVTARELVRLQAQSSIVVEIDGREFSAEYWNISGRLEPRTQRTPIEIILPSAANAQVVVGQLARVQLPFFATEKNFVSLSSISFESQSPYILTVNDAGKVQSTPLELGAVLGDGVIVQSGLEKNQPFLPIFNDQFLGKYIRLQDISTSPTANPSPQQ